MGHNISAIVGRAVKDELTDRHYDAPVFSEGEFVIVALNPCHSAHWSEKLELPTEAMSDLPLDDPWAHLLAKAFDLNPFAVIMTAYFGGTGRQSAVVYKNGHVLARGDINTALRTIGVVSVEGRDEFDTLNLGKYRNFDAYFEVYS